MVEIFNKEVLERCLKLYTQSMEKLKLPLDETDLEEAHKEAKHGAMVAFDEQHFGHNHAKQSAFLLEKDMQKVFMGDS